MIFFLVIGELAFGQARFSCVDSFGQLVRESNEGLDKTLIYRYNGIGNRNRKVEYAYDAFGNCEIIYGLSHDLAGRNINSGVGVFIAPFVSAGVTLFIEWTNERLEWLDDVKQWFNDL